MRKWNFNPGPATLPLSVLKKLKENTIELNGLGMSILEISHRSKDFEGILNETKRLYHKLLGFSDDYDTIFLGGGASLQFAMIPMNFLNGGVADYVITGSWSKKALKEAKLFGNPNISASTESENFTRLPKEEEIKYSQNPNYIHFTSNNTIYGTQWHQFPKTPEGVPVFCDMSSDILSRKFDPNKFSLIYAGAQKNLGPAGVTLITMKKELLNSVKEGLPTMLSYKTHFEANSLYNTPPVFAIYVVMLVLEWANEIGGLEKIEEINNQKAELLYGTIDKYADFYRGTVVDKNSRSFMNVTFRLPSEELEQKFIKEASSAGFHGLKGHRSVGGIRVSMYNAFPLEGIEKLCNFMEEFKRKN